MPLLRNALLAVLLCAVWSGVSAQPPMLEDADAAELIGSSIQSTEGVEVGEVSAVAIKADGEVTEIRMTMEQSLGMGQRTVVLPRDAYLILRGTVVVRLSLEEIRRLPSVDATRRQP